ncbi:MAG: hypothetical protein LBL13_07000 [Bacteroidales bacterium]|jgi:ribosome-binding factor A|nr:hypothetical protein [Bacteroidales bacterium]
MGAFEKMYGTVDCNEILYRLLNESTGLKELITGDIYMLERPDSSEREDIVINTPSVSQTKPQVGYSNINIYVPDMALKIEGREQIRANGKRLREIRNRVYAILEVANVPDLEFTIDQETPISASEINQHLLNVRINWYIC